MSEFVPFVEQVRLGDAMIDEIDDFVDMWHDGEYDVTLEEFLGLSEEDYHIWVANPRAIGLLIALQFDDPGFIEAVNDNTFDVVHQLAARSDSKIDMKVLRKWLKDRGSF